MRYPTSNQIQDGSARSRRRSGFCLLEDDQLITGFRTESERLLDPPDHGGRAKLVIRVTACEAGAGRRRANQEGARADPGVDST